MGARNIVLGEIEDPSFVTVKGVFDPDLSDDEHSMWLHEYGEGNYHRRILLPYHEDGEFKTVYSFSCQNTAFAFKMRFG